MKTIFLILQFIILFGFINLYGQTDTIPPKYKTYYDIREYVQRNVKYPPYAAENGISGTVKFEIKITSEGCIDSILIKETPHVSFDKQIIKILKKTKCDWEPAMYNKNPVDFWIKSKAVFVTQN